MFKCFTRMFHFSCNGFSLFAGKPLRTNTPFSTRTGKSLAGEQALLCGRAKRVSRERASERRSPSALRSLVLARHAQIGELSRRLEKAKIVECKIRSMRSRLLFLLSGVFSPMGRHHLKRTWTRSRDLTEFPGCKGLKTRWMCKKKLLFYFLGVLLVEAFIKVSIQSVLVMKLEENERFLGIWPLYLPIRE